MDPKNAEVADLEEKVRLGEERAQDLEGQVLAKFSKTHYYVFNLGIF